MFRVISNKLNILLKDNVRIDINVNVELQKRFVRELVGYCSRTSRIYAAILKEVDIEYIKTHLNKYDILILAFNVSDDILELVAKDSSTVVVLNTLHTNSNFVNASLIEENSKIKVVY